MPAGPDRPGHGAGAAVLVTSCLASVCDRDGRTYRVRVWARPHSHVGWIGWLEFVAAEPGRASASTGQETTQPSPADVARWAGGLGPLYLEGALERAHRLSGTGPSQDPVMVGQHTIQVRDAEGRVFRARIMARAEPRGTFIGWLEFEPDDREGPILRTGTETSQSTLDAIAYWANGLEAVYLEGAFRRARQATLARNA